ncbi:hypothetical protein P152DRAFT_457593 [Eremomyces bilateralis CBS 781.70]|uniref:NADH-ubiquinone oxidoreductase 29.9 kDa subunit n=1 Tax=Eremomyces bilateralis CBS 781.70 TaxID=1392243 RepID=A0A6G1G5L0_9PEZI|nr:uncharacterized protein P152DRAFT_457593 [Eremomyces bilateralis CBS 781.70]KAF1813226.1 hypothetical protein P152DRAFT_457593 [Eremomyces bilateralis CBS 781.70]
MRAATRLLARFLEPGQPTGLTGLRVHPSPRSTLIYLYSQTLSKLQTIPSSSAYRVATESLTKHRLQIIEESKPTGYAEWQQRIRQAIASDPKKYAAAGLAIQKSDDGREFVHMKPVEHIDWRGPKQSTDPIGEDMGAEAVKEDARDVHLEAEPQLTAEQISEVETKIGAGLIEEVIQVAEGELELANQMIKDKVWEELIEKPVEGQWTYFDRPST